MPPNAPMMTPAMRLSLLPPKSPLSEAEAFEKMELEDWNRTAEAGEEVEDASSTMPVEEAAVLEPVDDTLGADGWREEEEE